MTAATLAHLPLQVGGVALASAGRAALWVIARYMRAPLTNTAIAALVATTAMAGSNALWGQQHEHPAPMFAPVAEVARSEAEPVIPRVRPKSFAVGTPARTEQVNFVSAPAATPEPTGPIGNKDVFEVQRKLESMKLFSGTIDGYYGPQTARAIKQFQELKGLRATGTLDREVIDMILAAPLDMAGPKEQPVATPAAPAAPAATEVRAPAAVNLPAAQAAPVEAELPAARAAPAAAEAPATKPLASATAVNTRTLAALPQPKPLAATGTATATAAEPRQAAGAVKLLGRPVPDSPEQALEMAADTAGDAIDTIIGGVQSLAMTRPASRPAQFAPESRPLSTAEAAAPVQLKPTAAAAPAPEGRIAALPDNPRVGVPLQIEEAPPKPGTPIAVLDTEATPDEIMAPFSVTDPVIVAKVQRGLASLGFLHGPADGVAGEATAKAIRNFEVYFNYKVTGRISPELLDLLIDNGAAI